MTMTVSRYPYFVFAAALICLVCLSGSCAFAQEEAAKEKSASPVELLEANTKELLDGLGDEGLKTVYTARMRDGVIRAVYYIQKMVSGAVGACGEAQPDMKEPLEARYAKWWGTLAPLLEQAESHQSRTIEGQNVVPADKITGHLEMVSEAAEYTQGRLEKKYVTDREACQYLLDNMDVTEKSLSGQLRDTMGEVPIPGEDDGDAGTADTAAGDSKEPSAEHDD